MRIVLLGGTGFVGRELVRHLGRHHHASNLHVTITGRESSRHTAASLQHLAPSLSLSVEPLDALDAPALQPLISSAQRVVNLVGILHETPPRSTFRSIHAEFAKHVVDHMSDSGVLVHLSAIGADVGSKSAYARSKGMAEEAVSKHRYATILRPSIIFGPEDDFFNRFHALARYLPFLPLIDGGGTRFQPVHVSDVAKAIVKALHVPHPGEKGGRFGRYELGGEDVLTFRELMELTLRAGGRRRRRLLVRMPTGVARLQAGVFEGLHRVYEGLGPMLTRDQILLLERDNVVGREARTLADLDIEAMGCNVGTVNYLV